MEALQAVLLVGFGFLVVWGLMTLWDGTLSAGAEAVARLPASVVVAAAVIAGIVCMVYVGKRLLTITSDSARMAILDLLSDTRLRTHDEIRSAIRRNPRYRWDLMWFFPQYVSQAMGELVREGVLAIRDHRYTLSQRSGAAVPPAADGTTVFLCYRRTDSREHTSRIYDRLAAEFSPAAIYRDISNIPTAVPFPDHVRGALARVRVMVVVIGLDWLTVRDEAGHPRLSDPADHLRQELEFALDRADPRMAVLPVLVNGARMPTGKALPDSLRPLSDIHAMDVRPDPDFHADMARLIGRIRELLAEAGEVAPPPITR